MRTAAGRPGVVVRGRIYRSGSARSCPALALGLTIDEGATHLGIARGTAVQHRTLAALALGVRTAVELTHYAILEGWVQAGDPLSPELTDAALRKIARDVGDV